MIESPSVTKLFIDAIGRDVTIMYYSNIPEWYSNDLSDAECNLCDEIIEDHIATCIYASEQAAIDRQIDYKIMSRLHK